MNGKLILVTILSAALTVRALQCDCTDNGVVLCNDDGTCTVEVKNCRLPDGDHQPACEKVSFVQGHNTVEFTACTCTDETQVKELDNLMIHF